MKPELNNIRYREEEMSINLMLFNELGKMCNLISSYDKTFFNTPASEIEIASFKQKNKLLLPDELEKLYQLSNGFQILGRTAVVYELKKVGARFEDIPEEYVVFGEIVGDGEKLCFNEKTGEIVTAYKEKVFHYSLDGFLEYCIDQCMDGFFMKKPDLSACSILSTDTINSIQKLYSLKSVTIRELAEKFVQYDDEQREKYMYEFPIVIRAAVFSFLKSDYCKDFIKYLKNKDEIKADNFIRGMKRRAIDSFFNREKKALDDGKCSFPWNVQQMREIYNFNSEGMSYMNAGIVNAYDQAGNIVKDVHTNRASDKLYFDRKMSISYVYDVYKENQFLGNANNIKLNG